MSKHQYYKNLLIKSNFLNQINDMVQNYESQKIAIYGAGLLSSVIFENYDLSKLNIVSVIDIKFFLDKNSDFFGLKPISPYDISGKDIDVIWLFCYEYDNVKKYLESDIFPYYGKIKLEYITLN